MKKVVIVEGVRTPFCKMGTSFNFVSAQELGRIAAHEVLERSGIDPGSIDEVIFGNVSQPAEAANISRVIALLSGVPHSVPAFTVHRNCASGLEAVSTAALKIATGDAQCILAGGSESMSNIPFLFSKDFQEWMTKLSRAKTFLEKAACAIQFRLKFLTPRIGLQLGLTDPLCGLNMGETAEVLAKEFGISRLEQDAYALESHLKASRSKAILKEEMVAVLPAPKYKEAIDFDNGPRENQTMEALLKLRPIFDRLTGTVTAGNSSQVTDGAVALLVVSEEFAHQNNLKILGSVRAYAYAGVEPNRMGMGPAHAIPLAIKKAGLSFKDIQSFEINEAFAVQVLACLKAMDSKEFTSHFGYEGFSGAIDPKILNVHGGSIALGHPVGASGARLILTMLKTMNRDNLQFGAVSLCIGGGQGAAMILERT